MNYFIIHLIWLKNKREKANNMIKIIKSSLNNIKDYVHEYRKVRYTKKVYILIF